MSTPSSDPDVPPSGVGCAECPAAGGWWVHFRADRHAVVQSLGPGEDWLLDHAAETYARGPALASPTSQPDEQPAPGPLGAVPVDWQDHIHT